MVASYALRCAQNGNGQPGSYPVGDFIDEFKPFLGRNLRGWAFAGTPWRSVRALFGFLPGFRHAPLIVEELNRELFDDATLSELPNWILLNATNLQTGKNWKFFRDAAGDYLVGATTRTEKIRLAAAVTASAAHPLLVDPVPLSGHWQDYQAKHLDDRWERPPSQDRSEESTWRLRHGKERGRTTFQLADGGVYDNEGVNGLRGANVEHAVLSSATLTEGPFRRWTGIGSRLRTIAVMQRRLGAVNRQFAYEATHHMDPSTARRQLLSLADRLRDSNNQEDDGSPLADELEDISAVGWPPRGKQFGSCAMVLLHKKDVARNKSAEYQEKPYHVPAGDRGLSVDLVHELAQVRADLDAHDSTLVDILIAQGYFLADAHLKIGTPGVVRYCTGIVDRSSEALRPRWRWAHEVIDRANDQPDQIKPLISSAQDQQIGFGRTENRTSLIRFWASTIPSVLLLVAVVGAVVSIICHILF